jgi:uncharacterized protein HemX
MNGLEIAFSLLMIWALGLALVGVYWVRKEQHEVAQKKALESKFSSLPSFREQGTTV